MNENGAAVRLAPESHAREWFRLRPVLIPLIVVLASILGACAKKAPPVVVPQAPMYPNFVFPAVPAGFAKLPAAGSHEAAWQFLQAGNLRAAERSFAQALKQAPAFFPAEAGMGYLEIARRDFDKALDRFDRAIVQAPTYAPALVGRGEALLATSKDAEALQSFEAALLADPTLTDIQKRVEVLRFRAVDSLIAQARADANSGRLDQARTAYSSAIGASPDAAFLYRELAGVEMLGGDVTSALAHATRAATLDPTDAKALVLIGDLHMQSGNTGPAIEAYSRASAIEPSAALDEKIARAREIEELAGLPAEFRSIPELRTISRGELAALIGVRLNALLEQSDRAAAVVITDTRGHWATPWILSVIRSGVMEVYPNHTFQPGNPVRRGELGQVVSRVLNLIGTRDPALARRWDNAQGKFSDVPPRHLSYPAASRAVAAGVLPPLDGGTFQLARAVSGAEAIAAVQHLEELAQQAISRAAPRAPR